MLKDRSFRRTVIAITLPLAINNVMSFGVQMLDTVMVGRLGDSAVAAVSLATQPYFIYQVLLYGLVSGGSILVSQYWGQGDVSHIRRIMALMLKTVAAVSAAYALLCAVFPSQIMHIYSQDESIIGLSVSYLRVVVLSYVLAGLANSYFSALQAKEDVRVSTVIYAGSFFVNVIANYILIFGHLGLPAMGVVGAAAGTVIARGFECLAAWAYARFREREIGFSHHDIIKKDRDLFPHYLRVSLPVIGDDLVWSLGSSARVAIIGNIGTVFVTAASVAGIAEQFAMIMVYSVARTASIMIGKTIGTGDRSKAKSMGDAFLALSVLVGVAACGVVLLVRGPLLMLYPDLSADSRSLAYGLMGTIAAVMLVCGIETTSIIGVLRGAGDNRFALAMDAGGMWLLSLPLGLLAAKVLHWPAGLVYVCLRSDSPLKAFICAIRVRKGNYIRDMTKPQ